MDCSMPDFFVLYYLLELSPLSHVHWVNVHWVNDAMQPFHYLSPPSSPALHLSQHQDLFQWVSDAMQPSNSCPLSQWCHATISLSVTPFFPCPSSFPVSGSFPMSQWCHATIKLMSIESMMPCNYLIICHPLLLLPFIFPSIRVFSNESVLHIRWPKYWSFSFSISLSNEYLGWIPLELPGLISLLSKGLSRVFSSTTIWKHQFSKSNALWTTLEQKLEDH